MDTLKYQHIGPWATDLHVFELREFDGVGRAQACRHSMVQSVSVFPEILVNKGSIRNAESRDLRFDFY